MIMTIKVGPNGGLGASAVSLVLYRLVVFRWWPGGSTWWWQRWWWCQCWCQCWAFVDKNGCQVRLRPMSGTFVHSSNLPGLEHKVFKSRNTFSPFTCLWPGVESLWHHSSLQVRPARPFRLKEISRKKDRKHFSLFCNQSSEVNILFQIEKLSGIGMQLTSTTGIPRWWWQWWHQCCDDNDDNTLY